MTDPDKRGNERVTLNKQFGSVDSFVEACVTNVSHTGVFLQDPKPLPVGTEVNLCFTVIVDGVQSIEGLGEVVRVQTDPPGMGVVFRELSPSSRALLDRLLARAERS